MRLHQKQSRHQTGTVIPTATATAILLSIVVWREEKDESSRLVDHSLYFHCPEWQWWMNDSDGWMTKDDLSWCWINVFGAFQRWSANFFLFLVFVFVFWFFLFLSCVGSIDPLQSGSDVCADMDHHLDWFIHGSLWLLISWPDHSRAGQ